MISYAMTVYNKAAFLPLVLHWLDAEWQQTGGEIIIVNDGSTDDSATVLDGFAGSRPHVRVIHQQNQGVSAATNAGVQACREQSIRLVDGDDLLLPGSTLALHRAATQTGCTSAFGLWGDWTLASPPQAEETTWSAPRVVTDPLRLALKSQMFVPSSVLLGRRDADRIFPIGTTLRTSQDFMISLRLAVLGPVAALPQRVCVMGKDEHGLSRSKAKMYADSARIIADHWQDWSPAHRRYAIRRNAQRAYLYARRHLSLSGWEMARLQMLRLLSYLPLPVSEAAPQHIGNSYAEALRSPQDYP